MKKGEKLILLVPAGIIAITFIVYLYRGHINFQDINFEKLNTFGAFVGGLIGSFLTVVATLYVYKTFYSQKEELAAQKKELKLQKELITQQQFENTFFNLINVHRELKNSLTLESGNDIFRDGGWGAMPFTYNGIEVISKIAGDFIKIYETYDETFVFGQDVDNTFNDKISKKLETDFQEVNIKDFFNDPQNPEPELINFDEHDWNENNNSIEYQLKKLNYFFKLLFQNYQNQISHYCRNVYHILKFIRENEIRENKGEESKIKFKQYQTFFSHS